MRFDLNPFDNIDAARAWARGQVDQAAGAARARHLTVVAGQEAVYAAKYADALAYARAGYPDSQLAQYPWVAAEALATGLPARLAAEGIRAAGDPWNLITGPAIESLRIGSKTRIEALQSIAEVVAETYRTRQALADA